MKNQISDGRDLNVLVPAGGFIAGNLYFVGNMFGVSANTNVAGDTGVLSTGHVWSLPKLNAEAWVAGAPVFWDGVNKWATIAAGALKAIGVATDPAANPSPTGNVRLNDNF